LSGRGKTVERPGQIPRNLAAKVDGLPDLPIR
jgi:hypothetical protein